MNKGLIILAAVMAVFITVTLLDQGAIALVVCAGLAVLIISQIRARVPDVKTQNFLSNVFLIALMIRVLLAAVIFGFELQENFGPDALFYDEIGGVLAQSWWGEATLNLTQIKQTENGWGMYYLVGTIYFIFGQNALLGQFLVAILGSLSTLTVYYSARDIFHNNRVARYACIFVALFPGMIVWTSQLLKDGIIVFLLMLTLLAAIRLKSAFSIFWIAVLMTAIFGIASLRFYIFFMIVGAVAINFVFSFRDSKKNLLNRLAVCAVIGLVFTYLGIWQALTEQTTNLASLNNIETSRSWAAKSESGIASEDVNVSTMSGLIAALPAGIVTLYLAPFPWQVTKLTQVLTMPEMILWWCTLPFIISGVIYTVRNRFSEASTILFFVLMLSLFYAVYQGNLGTLYRQRAQIQVFLLIFAAVGLTMSLEKKENTRVRAHARHPRVPTNSPGTWKIQTKGEEVWQNRAYPPNPEQIAQAQKMLTVSEPEKPDKIPKSVIETFQVENISDKSESHKRVQPEEIDFGLDIPQPEISVAANSFAADTAANGNGSSAEKKRGLVFRASKEQIMSAQKMLKEKAVYSGEETGKLDDATREGLKKFQETNGVKVTGTLNQMTLEKMKIELTDKQKENSTKSLQI